MATVATVEVRVVVKEDTEILGIAGTTSEIKIADNEQTRNLEEEVVNNCETEHTTISAQDETTNIEKSENPNNVSLTFQFNKFPIALEYDLSLYLKSLE